MTSPSYPNIYPPNADCIYNISQATGTVILLEFTHIDIDGGDTLLSTEYCHDYLKMHDGPSEDSPLMYGKICGEHWSRRAGDVGGLGWRGWNPSSPPIPYLIQSKQNQMLMM